MQANVVDKSTGIMDVRNRSVILGALTLIVIVGLFWDGIVDLISTWDREEYSHGYLVPPIAVFLLLRGLANTSPERDHSSWSGVIVCLFAVALGLLGILGKIPDLVQYGLIIALVGLFGVQVGWRSLLKLWAPFMCLGFMIPLPQFIYLKLSAFMQLISSELGVAFIRWIGIPVFLEGNVIDLGVYQLQVAEACNGLRYLFPLMSFGFLFAVLYSGPWWHRTILFLATIPITIIINSFRIGMIGVLVDGYGIEQAEGFLHYFEGWIIFVACVALLFGTAYLLSRLGRLGKPLGEILDFGTDNLSIGAKRLMGSTAIGPHIAVCALFLVILIGLHTVPQ